MFFNSTLPEDVLHGSFHAFFIKTKLLQNSVDLQVHNPKGWRLHLAYSLHFWHKLHGQMQKSLSVATTFHSTQAYLEYTDSYSVMQNCKLWFETYSCFCNNRIWIWKTVFLFPQKCTLENSLDRKCLILLIYLNINCKVAYENAHLSCILKCMVCSHGKG